MENKSMMTLDDVLNEFVTASEEPSRKNLEEWVERYPQYRRELVDFAATWAEQVVLPPEPELGPEREKTLVDRAMSHVQNVAFERDEKLGAQAQSGEPIDSLTKQAQRAGLNVQEFANSCFLDLALVSKLNSRQIELQTIPARLIRLVARLLNKPVEAVASYLARPPQSLAGKAFLSRDKPANAGRQSFPDAIRASSLSEAEKTRWLDQGADEKED